MNTVLDGYSQTSCSKVTVFTPTEAYCQSWPIFEVKIALTVTQNEIFFKNCYFRQFTIIYAWRILCSEVIFLKENCCYCLLLRSFLFLTICHLPTLLNLLPVSTNWSSLFISLFFTPWFLKYTHTKFPSSRTNIDCSRAV